LRLLLQSLVYDNFEIYNPTLSLELIVWSICSGLMIGAVFTYLNKRVIGGFVRSLIAKEALSPEKACTVGEITGKKNRFLRSQLQAGKSLRRLVHCANEEDMPRRAPSQHKTAAVLRRIFSLDAEEKILTDFDTARFYIPEDLRIRAEFRYSEKGSTLPSLILSLLLLLAGGFAVLYLLPELFSLTDSLLTMLG
jgi:hypothetical protein